MSKLPNIKTKNRSSWKLIAEIGKIAYTSNKGNFIAFLLLCVLAASLGFVQSGSFSRIVTEISEHGIAGANYSVIAWSVVLVGLFSFIPSMLTYLNEIFWGAIDRKTNLELADKLNNSLAELDIATIEQSEFQNIAHQANTRGFSSALSMLAWSFGNIQTIFQFIFSAVLIIYINPLAIAFALIGSLPVYFTERRSSINAGNLWTLQTEFYRLISEKTKVFTNSKMLVELKLLLLPHVFRKKINETRTKIDQEIAKADRKDLAIGSLSELFYGISYTGAIFLVVLDVLHGKTGLGNLVFIYATLTTFQISFGSILRSFGRIEQHRKHANKLFDVFEMDSYLKETQKATEIDYGKAPEIEFKNVSFAYPGTKTLVIKDVNFKIRSGERLAIVGLNGAGKTTLVKLMCRIYDPTKGKILINGIDLKKISLSQWQQMIGILFQDYSLYQSETVATNIALGNPMREADPESIVKSGMMANADEFIARFPKDYDESIGVEFHGGVELSKGEQQKIALARIFYKNAPLMILDEPTAAVDAVSEDIIFKSIIGNSNKQTTVLISHKFSNVRDADEIILIEHGTVIEQGTHKQLMKLKRGTYKGLFELQAEGYK